MKQGILFSFFFVMFAFAVNGQTHNAISEQTRHKIDSTYQALIKKHKIAGLSIAIVDNGQIVYSTGYGFADVEKQLPATDETVYRIGSVTKAFTSMAVMQLHENGLINYQNSITDYIPELEMPNRFGDQNRLRLPYIMSHTAGMPSDVLNAFFCLNPPDQSWIIPHLNQQHLIAPEGYTMAYSNAGYGLLGEMIERKSGLSYNDYLVQNIFSPLQMDASYVNFDESLGHTLSMGYKGKKPLEEPLIRDQAAGLIHSNVLNMANFALTMLNHGSYYENTVISPESVQAMETDMLAQLTLPGKSQYGFGLFINDLAFTSEDETDTTSVKYFNHGGDTYTFHADFGYIRDLGVGAVILTNTTSGTKANNVKNLITLYLKEQKGLELFNDPGNDETEEESEVLTINELQGHYSTMAGLVDVDNATKISFRQGPAKVILKRDDLNQNFSAKAILFGFIPIKLKGQEFNFRRVENDIFLEAFLSPSGNSMYIGRKEDPSPIPSSWMEAMGQYELTGETFENKPGFPYTTEGMTAQLKEDEGFILFKLKSKTGMLNMSMYVNAFDENTALGATFGRNSGNTIKILPNGNIYFLGLEFARKQ